MQSSIYLMLGIEMMQICELGEYEYCYTMS